MPTRALQRVKRALRRPTLPSPQAAAPGAYDGWLELLDDVLGPIDAACAAGERDLVALCGDLDLELWALLVTQEYRRYSHLRAVLPSVPATCRPAGSTAATQSSRSSTSAARTACRRRSPAATSSSSACRSTSRSTSRSRSRCSRTSPRPPTGAAWLRCTAVRSCGILVATIRLPAYLYESPLMESVRGRAEEPFVFAPHSADPSHPQYAGPEMAYGETVIAVDYVRERWARWFELLHVDLLLGDLHQVVLTLRRRE
jgi:hypothetical protein